MEKTVSLSTTATANAQGKPYTKKVIFFIVVTILVVLVILFIFSMITYVNLLTVKNKVNGPVKIERGIFAVFDTDFLCNKVFGTCVSNNAATPYSRALFPTKGDRPFYISNLDKTEATEHLVGAHEMSYNEAVLVVGEIPRNRTYWALTGNLYNVPSDGPPPPEGRTEDQRLVIAASIGDSIDSSNTFSTGENSYLALVISPNPNMFEVVQQQFKDNPRIFLPTDGYSFQWKYLPVPSNMYASQYKYCTFGRILQTKYDQSIPHWDCWWLTAEKGYVAAPTENVPAFLSTRSTTPNEYLIYFPPDPTKQKTPQQQWYDAAYDYAVTSVPEGTSIDQKYQTYTIPFLSWIPGICPDPKDPNDCGLRCGCQALFYSQNARFDNNSTIYYTSVGVPPNLNGIVVKKGYTLLIVALNHVATTAVICYSSITVSDFKNETTFAGYITGIADPLDPEVKEGKWPPKTPWTLEESLQSIIVKLPNNIWDENGECRLVVTERAYINPNKVGPWYSAIAACNVFIIPAPTSAQDYTIPYNWSIS